MKEDIERVVLQSVESIGNKINLTDLPVVVEVEIPKRKEFGDFSVNTAMLLARKMGRNPRQVAELIIENLPARRTGFLEKSRSRGRGSLTSSSGKTR